MANETKLKAHAIKARISRAIQAVLLRPLTQRHDAFHNPIADLVKRDSIHFNAGEKRGITEFERSAKLTITPKNQQILLNYFISRRNENDKLGNHYKTLTFAQFILRLANKRFKTVYYDGRAIILRNGEVRSDEGKAFLERLGTAEDMNNLYKDYLTLEEAVLSPLIIPQATSVFIGTGTRTKEQNWNVKEEFEESVDCALVSYPAAAEIRNGQTAHYDCLFIVKPAVPTPAYLNTLNAIRANPALMIAAIEIYGNTFAFEADEVPSLDFETILENGQTHYLHKQAYLKRTENMLRSTLLAADAQMAADGLGTTFQLKGLGLGAFSFSGYENTRKIQSLYQQALRNVLKAKDFELKHIQCINLINLPSDIAQNNIHTMGVKHEYTKKGVSVIRSVMDPTTKTKQNEIGEIGGLVVCGDSGSKFGNEGNIGLDRKSSDDPAAQYSLLNPLILDPQANEVLRNEDCIKIVDNAEFKTLAQIDLPQVANQRMQPRLIEQLRNYALMGSLACFSAALLSPFILKFIAVDLSLFCLPAGIIVGLVALTCEVIKRATKGYANAQPIAHPVEAIALDEPDNAFTPMLRHRRNQGQRRDEDAGQEARAGNRQRLR